jgi:hypothetical protein
MTFKQFYYIVLKKRGVRFPLKKNKYRRFWVWGILLKNISDFCLVFYVQIFNTRIEFILNTKSIFFSGIFPFPHKFNYFFFTVTYQLNFLKKFKSKFFRLDVYNNWNSSNIFSRI